MTSIIDALLKTLEKRNWHTRIMPHKFTNNTSYSSVISILTTFKMWIQENKIDSNRLQIGKQILGASSDYNRR